MLSISTIARVAVNTVRASASPDSFNTGLLLIRDTNYAAARRLQAYDSAQAAAEGLTALGFGTSTEPYKAALKYFAASPAPGRLLVSCHPASETPEAALDAVLDLTAAFYGVMTCDTLTASDVGAVLGTAMGLELSHRGSAFALCYKTLHGIQPSALTQSEVETLKALNCNVYVARGYTHYLLENGTVSHGERYDEILYVDQIAADLQNAAVTLLAENPDRLPQTDDATAQFINRFSAILMGYAGRGILATAAWRGADTGPLRLGDIVENGFLLWADSYDTQSEADRAAHKAMPVQVALTLAGSLESIVINVNVQL